MAKPKNPQSFIQELLESHKNLDERQPIQKSRWYIREVTPAYHESGYYGGWVEEESKRVSPYFDSEEKAVAWAEKHDPEPGAEFKLSKQNLRKMTHLSWVSY